VKILGFLTLILALTGCAKKAENNEAVRTAIVQHVAKTMSMDAMDIQVSSVTFHGDNADAVATFVPKGMPSSAVSFNYDLERDGAGWKVKGRGRMNSDHGKGAQVAPNAGGDGGMPQGHPMVSGEAAPPVVHQQ
jgi:hypothetical protein